MAKKIKVHEKALAHLSRGLYRSPASALRELVSNAWDANAEEVVINTNYPNFFQISVEDNGYGFTKREFESLMEGGIGNSSKRPTQKPLIHNRPIIGRLGIGMLGIAQICGTFTVISKPKHGEGFRARVILYDLLKELLDKDDRTVVKTQEIDIGEYLFEDFDPKDVSYGTLILTDDVHPTFVRSFQNSLKFEKFKQPPLDWAKALKIVSQVHSLQELGDYWRLLWELSATCPVPYLSENALPKRLIAEEQSDLLSYDFKVLVDGISLFKPVYLKGNPGGYTTHKIERQERKVYGKNLSFHGYLILQEGAQLRPDELRGIMIRIKNVGIGYYDPSLLDYRFNEGPRSRWLTGEIFVDEGLEDALNVDRDSFNRFQPDFKEIQEYVHGILHEKIFPASYKQIDLRSTERAEVKSKARNQHLKRVISEMVDAPVVIRHTLQTAEAKQTPEVSFVKEKAKIEITIPETEAVKTKKPYRHLATAILALYEVAIQEKTHEKQKEVFTQLLLELFKEW